MATSEKVVFKRGVSTSLPSTKVPGTVLITTDTGDMYVDDTPSTRVRINAGSAERLKTTRSLDGVNFNGGANVSRYGTCSTAAATASKVVSIANYVLVTGSRAVVKFTITNTAASPTLNINNTGAKSIQYRGSAISAGYLAANRTYEFVYDGKSYQLVGDLDTNSDTKVTQNAAIATDGNYPILIGATTATTAVTSTVNKTSSLLYNPSTKTLTCSKISATIDDGSIS